MARIIRIFRRMISYQYHIYRVKGSMNYEFIKMGRVIAYAIACQVLEKKWLIVLPNNHKDVEKSGPLRC